MNLKRRQFLKLTGITAAGLPLAKYATAATGFNIGKAEDLVFNSFLHPLNIHQPFVRWWWNGDPWGSPEWLNALIVPYIS